MAPFQSDIEYLTHTHVPDAPRFNTGSVCVIYAHPAEAHVN